VSSATTFTKVSNHILGHEMSWIEGGDGRAVVLLHGNLASSFLWRDVLEHLDGIGRVIAPDLIGMGASEKLDAGDRHRYTFDRHAGFLDALLSHVRIGSDVVLVGLGWGGALAFDWANRHRSQTAGVGYMEAFIRPLAWSDIPDEWSDLLSRLRTDEGEGLVMRRNILIKDVLPALTLRGFRRLERMAYTTPYRRPGEERLPLLAWCRELPIEGSPLVVSQRVDSYSQWLSESDVPKLLIRGDPGLLVNGRLAQDSLGLSNQRIVTVPGVHLLPEDSPEAIGRAISSWITDLRG
jgi:haloalkane dehalogenase